LTLVELLVTISIIAILASIMLGALQVATQEAKSMKTKSMISKLNNLIMPRYEAYRTRRVPINILIGTSPLQAAKYRLDALHELMRMELPDRWTDITDLPVTFTSPPATPPATIVPPTPAQAISRPALNQAYLRAYYSAPSTPSATYQDAECLYLVVSLGFVDELGGRDLFNESSIGDVDNDGFSEFLDAWGSPIGFLRWPVGFTDSELNGGGGTLAAVNGPTQLLAAGSPVSTPSTTYGLARRNGAYNGRQITIWNPTLTMSAGGPQTATVATSVYDPSSGQTTLYLTTPLNPVPTSGSFGIDPDPFDSTPVYPNATAKNLTTGLPIVPFATYPVIYSAGPDKTVGMVLDFPSSSPIHYSTLFNFPFLTEPTYQSVGTTQDVTDEQSYNTSWQSNGWLDNIHNHLIGTR
jgi:type II secretory pathway pseudopilin PulG